MENTIKLKNTKMFIWSIAFKLVAIFGAAIGITSTMFGGAFMSASSLLYFTIQSNITIAIICIVFLVLEIMSFTKKQDLPTPNWLIVLKLVFTVAISLTFLVFSCLLTPEMVINGNAEYLATASNICCHNIVPIFAILDWFIIDRNQFKFPKKMWVFGIAMPLYYVFFTYILSFSGVMFGGSIVPYFFFNYKILGWFNIGKNGIGVIYWIIILVLLVLLISYIFARPKKSTKAEQ